MGLSRTLERVRAAFRRRPPARHRRPAMPPVAPHAVPQQLAPDVWGARLVTARGHRRGGHAQGEAWQPQLQPCAQWSPPASWEDAGAIVRPYVIPPEERQHALSVRQFAEESR